MVPFGTDERARQLHARFSSHCLVEGGGDVRGGRDPRRPNLRLIQTMPQARQGMNFETFGNTRLAAEQPLQADAERSRQRFGEGREQHAPLRVRPSQVSGAMNRDNGLPRSGRTGHSRRTGVVAFNELPLLRMQEDRPFVPGRIQRLRQFVDAGDDAEPALRIRMRKRVGRRCNPRHLRCAAGGQLQHRFHGFGRQVGSQGQQAIFIGLPHIVQPLLGYPVSQQLLIRHAEQWPRHLPRRGFSLDIRGNHDFADRFAQLDQARCVRGPDSPSRAWSGHHVLANGSPAGPCDKGQHGDLGIGKVIRQRRKGGAGHAEEVRKTIGVSEQPRLDLTNHNSKPHELTSLRQPIRHHQRSARKVLIQINQHQPRIALSRAVVARESSPEVGLALLDLDAMNVGAASSDQPSDDGLVRNSLNRDRDVRQLSPRKAQAARRAWVA